VASVLDALTRQICFEEGCSVWTDITGDDRVADTKLRRAMGSSPFSLVHIPELSELGKCCSRIFVRQDGFQFRVIFIRRVRNEDFKPPLTIARLRKLGEAFVQCTGRVAGTRLPVWLEMIELHKNGMAPDYPEQMKAYAHKPIASSVGIAAAGIDEKTGRIASSYWGWGRRRIHRNLRRAWESREESPDAYEEIVANADFKAGHALIGAIAGGGVAVASYLALSAAEITNGLLYGAATILGGVVAAAISLSLSRVRRQGLAQGLGGGLSGFVVATAGWWWLGGQVTVDIAAIGLLTAVISAALGHMGNTVVVRN